MKPRAPEEPNGARGGPEVRRGTLEARRVPGMTCARSSARAEDAPGPLMARRCPPRARGPPSPQTQSLLMRPPSAETTSAALGLILATAALMTDAGMAMAVR